MCHKKYVYVEMKHIGYLGYKNKILYINHKFFFSSYVIESRWISSVCRHITYMIYERYLRE